MNKNVTLIDYGIGNLLSVSRAFEYCGATVKTARTPADIEQADRLVLPGVGAFSDGMQGLRERGLIAPIQQHAASDKPLLGICLGMQMLASVSEEFGEHKGLNIIRGTVRAIPKTSVNGEALRVPHIGWSDLYYSSPEAVKGTLLRDTAEKSAVYLVHSFMMQADDNNHLLAWYLYGGHRIPAVIQRGAVYGCQFHPEKSGEIGLKIIAAFLSCTAIR